MFSSCPAMASALGLHVVVMITSIDVSQEIFAMDMLKALKSFSKHRRKHVLRPLQPLFNRTIMHQFSFTFIQQNHNASIQFHIGEQ